MIENGHPEDITVFLRYAGAQIRIATVTSLTTRTVDLGPWLRFFPNSDLQFEIRALASRTAHLVPCVDMIPGDLVHLTVRPNLMHSRIWKAPGG